MKPLQMRGELPAALLTAALVLVATATSLPAQDKLVFAFDIIRHGDRTPLSNLFREDSTNWPEGLGKMTSLGTNQEYKLGTDLRQRYYRELLASNATPESVRVFSTDTDRTRQSARLCISGLIGEAGAAIPVQLRVPINVAAPESDTNSISTTLLMAPDATPALATLISQYLLQSPEWTATNAALQPQFARWSQAVTRPINTVQDLIGLGDSMYIHQIHHVPLPDGLSPEDVQDIMAAGRWAFVFQYRPEIRRIRGSSLLNKAADYLEEARREVLSHNAATVKYVLFSAHDSTLLTEMSALQSPLTGTNAPPYSAYLHFALFQTKGTNFHVLITYHDMADHIVPDPEHGGASWSLEQLAKGKEPD